MLFFFHGLKTKSEPAQSLYLYVLLLMPRCSRSNLLSLTDSIQRFLKILILMTLFGYNIVFATLEGTLSLSQTDTLLFSYCSFSINKAGLDRSTHLKLNTFFSKVKAFKLSGFGQNY
uniref:Uncharacterized protein n=1 Tax=Schistocephalus solidus TaxID=70667 RepID=A0A0X3NPT9_SCHSO